MGTRVHPGLPHRLAQLCSVSARCVKRKKKNCREKSLQLAHPSQLLRLCIKCSPLLANRWMSAHAASWKAGSVMTSVMCACTRMQKQRRQPKRSMQRHIPLEAIWCLVAEITHRTQEKAGGCFHTS